MVAQLDWNFSISTRFRVQLRSLYEDVWLRSAGDWGGVVGLALSRLLAQAGREVALVEQGSRFGSVTSSRHSEVIHAGLYYEPGSLKAESALLVAGCSTATSTNIASNIRKSVS